MSDDSSNGGAGVETPEAVLGPAEAAAIMREQEARAQRAFRVSHRGAFVGWGGGHAGGVRVDLAGRA
jgi:hypothetical protein